MEQISEVPASTVAAPRAYIYCIVPTVPECDESDAYYGSTYHSPHFRFRQHRNQYTSRLKGKKVSYCYSFRLFEKYGPENCRVDVVEAINDDISRQDLNTREHSYISSRPCLNKSGKVRVKDDPRAYHRQYRQDHLESYQEYQKQYRLAHREKFLEKVVCTCGKEICKRNLGNHLLSRQHKTVSIPSETTSSTTDIVE